MTQKQQAIIIGASRGLGVGLVRELTGRGWDVVGTQRTHSAELAEAGASSIETVDINDKASVAALAAKLAGRSFDLVYINAGVSAPEPDSADTITQDEIGALMLTNAIAPIRTARALLPLVADGGTLAFMTSGLGSVSARNFCVYEVYSASKAALNSLTRGFVAQDVGKKPISVINVHPGWVRTDMGGEEADIDVATSVAGIADMLAANTGPGHRFLDYRGETIGW
jgi:NAD(P)-dependent dehydrogenase (short-subunit alcohol dehydrogenase family)